MDLIDYIAFSTIGGIAYIVYDSLCKKFIHLENSISKFEKNLKMQNQMQNANIDRIDMSQDLLHEHREFFEFEIAKIYNKLEQINEEQWNNEAMGQ